jgi:hypothetical protein
MVAAPGKGRFETTTMTALTPAATAMTATATATTKNDDDHNDDQKNTTTTTTTTTSNSGHYSSSPVPLPPTTLAHWPTVHETMMLIRTQQFGRLYQTTQYPLLLPQTKVVPLPRQDQPRRHEQQRQQRPNDETLPRSRETVVPFTRSVRTSTGYRYYHFFPDDHDDDKRTMTTMTGWNKEISCEEYQVRYERAVLNHHDMKIHWGRYFTHLRWQRAVAAQTTTVVRQMARSRQFYAMHIRSSSSSSSLAAASSSRQRHQENDSAGDIDDDWRSVVSNDSSYEENDVDDDDDDDDDAANDDDVDDYADDDDDDDDAQHDSSTSHGDDDDEHPSDEIDIV